MSSVPWDWVRICSLVQKMPMAWTTGHIELRFGSLDFGRDFSQQTRTSWEASHSGKGDSLEREGGGCSPIGRLQGPAVGSRRRFLICTRRANNLQMVRMAV